MAVATLEPAQYRVVPWKNGRGSTTELYLSPPGATLADFSWRLSIAELTEDGPFSPFDGYERSLTQLEGPPVTLFHGDARHELALEAPHAFPGEAPTRCEVRGPARDFNAIARRERWALEVRAHSLAERETFEPLGAEQLAVYVLRGALREAPEGTLRAGMLALREGRFSALALEGSAVLCVRLDARGAARFP